MHILRFQASKSERALFTPEDSCTQVPILILTFVFVVNGLCRIIYLYMTLILSTSNTIHRNECTMQNYIIRSYSVQCDLYTRTQLPYIYLLCDALTLSSIALCISIERGESHWSYYIHSHIKNTYTQQGQTRLIRSSLSSAHHQVCTLTRGVSIL